MKKKHDQILKNLEIIFEKKIKPKDKTDELDNFDSIIILQIMNLAKTKYNKNIDGLKISKCKTISEIIDTIS
tara:strand:- start:110 stop:325 length:216 start_codon:yes stop_codon:yes gene_type:complete